MYNSAQPTMQTHNIESQIVENNHNHTLFSWSKQNVGKPIAIKYGQGVYLFDYEGKRYLDFSSGLMNVNIGHGNQRVTEAVAQQMRQISYINPNCVTDVRGLLGKKLAEICPPGLNKAFFTVCGASAIENAIKLARHYTGRPKILTRYQSYHGASYGAISASGDPRKLPVDEQQAPNFVHFDLPYAYRWPHGNENFCNENIAQLERILTYEGPTRFAAILLEGESGSSGCLQYPVGYLQGVREICNRYGILLIMDEVMSGFCRTGKWFGFQNHGIEPDMICMAKGLTSGYLPMGCLMVHEKIAEKYDHEALPLGLTYSAHPVCCAAALEVIKIYEEKNLMQNTLEMSAYINQKAAELMQKHPSIGNWRNTGLLGCFELVKNRQTKEPMAPFNATIAQMEVMNKVALKIKELGMNTFVRWSYIFCAPPLCINRQQIDDGMQIISQAISIADEYVTS